MTYVVVLYFPIFPGKYQYSPLKLMKFQLHVKTFKNLLIPMASQPNLSIPQWILRTTMYLKWAPWITSFYWCILIFFKCNRDKFNFYNKILRKPIFLNIYQMNLNQLTLVYPKIKILKFSDNDTQISHNDTLVNPIIPKETQNLLFSLITQFFWVSLRSSWLFWYQCRSFWYKLR